MSKNILLAVDAPSGDPARHVSAAVEMTHELGRDTGDHVIVLHVHEFAVGRFGRLRVDCGDGDGERVVETIVSDLRSAGISAQGAIGEANLGHIAAAIPNAAQAGRSRTCWREVAHGGSAAGVARPDGLTGDPLTIARTASPPGQLAAVGGVGQ